MCECDYGNVLAHVLQAPELVSNGIVFDPQNRVEGEGLEPYASYVLGKVLEHLVKDRLDVEVGQTGGLPETIWFKDRHVNCRRHQECIRDCQRGHRDMDSGHTG